MVFFTDDTWQKIGVEIIILDKIKWLNEKHIEEQLQHSNLTMITTKYPLYLRKERQELQECIKEPCRKFLREDFAIQTIIFRSTMNRTFSFTAFGKIRPVLTNINRGIE